jgi:serine-type D-Ala-D-Ala carboxypeptidase
VPPFDSLRRICQQAVNEQVTPGLVVVVGQAGRNVFHDAFGQRQIEPYPLPTTPETVYDLASLTKALVTTLLAMRAVERGQLRLDDPLLPLREPTPDIAQTLSHRAGFPAHRRFYERVSSLPPAHRRARMLELAAAEPFEYPPGTRAIYSDLGFINLGAHLERVLATPLDALTSDLFSPLGLPTLRFAPRLLSDASRSPSDAPRLMDEAGIAATQRCGVRGRVLLGEVDDLNAWAMEGVAGHAGLFGNATDVAGVAHALCAAWRGTGTGGAAPIVSRGVLREFWRERGSSDSHWRLGWDGPAPTGSLAGERIARRAVGHLAFTGCSIWIDPERETFVVVLANRVHPVPREDGRFRALRPALNDAALEGAGYQP